MNLLTAMRVFDRVCLLNSFSAAARDLNMSTTAVSRVVRELEEDLGVRLLNLDDIQEMQDDTRGLHGATRGLLRISCSHVLAHTRITRLVPRFLAENPNVTVEFDLTSRYIVGVVEEGYDVAIRFEAQSDSQLVARRLGQVRNFVCATPSYLDANGRPTHPDELASHSCVLSNFARRLGTWPFRSDNGAFSVPVGGRVSTNSVEAAFQMTMAGFGIGNLPGILVDAPIRAGQLEVLLDEFRPEPSPIYALYPHRTYVATKVRAFVDFLMRELSPDLV